MEEQRATLHPADFARFWECRWTEPKGSWITKEMYDAAVTRLEALAAEPTWRCVGFVDVGLIHDATAVAVCHREGDLVVLDALRTMQGSKTAPVELEALEDLVEQLTERFKVRSWTFEAPQAVASVQRLQKRIPHARVEARYPTAETQARLFGGLYQLLSNRRLALFPHEQLRREALNLVTKTVAGRLKVVDSSAIHQDHVIALGGAADMLMAGGKVEAALELTRDLVEIQQREAAEALKAKDEPPPTPERAPAVETGIHCGAFGCRSNNASPANARGVKTNLCPTHLAEFQRLGWLTGDGTSTTFDQFGYIATRYRR